jgi:hypothetical protein
MGIELFAASRRPGVHCCGMSAARPAHRGSQFVRQWRLLRTLEGAKRGMTVAQLKEAIEETQSTRTLYRDLDAEERTISKILTEQLCYEIPPYRLIELAKQTWTI